jgi:hypothetical protein
MKTIPLTFSRSDCQIIIDASYDKDINGLMGAADSPIWRMFKWLKNNSDNSPYNAQGSVQIEVPTDLASDYVVALMALDIITKKWDFRGMAFRANPLIAAFCDQAIPKEDEGFRWN